MIGSLSRCSRAVTTLVAAVLVAAALPGSARAADAEWSATLSAEGSLEITRVTAFPTGVYVGGEVQGTLQGQTRAGLVDVYVAKLDDQGTVLWTRQFGTADDEYLGGLAADTTGVYVVGWTRGSLPGWTNAGGEDAFIAKYDHHGGLLWVRQFGGMGGDRLTGVAVGPDHGVYVTGVLEVDDPALGFSGVLHAFVRRYGASGDLRWHRQFAAWNEQWKRWLGALPAGIAADVIGPVVAGWSDGSILPFEVARSEADTWLRRFSTEGDVLWSRQFDLEEWSEPTGERAEISNVPHAVGLDAGGITVTGSSRLGSDPYVRRYDLRGNIAWTKAIRGGSVKGVCDGFAIAGSDGGGYASPPRPTGAWAAGFTGAAEELWRLDQPGDEGEWVFRDIDTFGSAAYIARQHTVYSPETTASYSVIKVSVPTVACPTLGSTGPVSVGAGSTYTRSATVTVSAPAINAFYVRLSNDGRSWATYPYSSLIRWSLTDARYGGSSANGVKTVWVQWRGASGSWSPAKSDTIVLDTAAPAVRAPVATLLTNATLGTWAIPARLNWWGSDATSGIARYELMQSVNGGAWNRLALPTPTATRFHHWLGPGYTHRFALRAMDRAGNWSGWAYSPTIRVGAHQETSAALRYGGTWTRAYLSGAYGSYVKYATASGVRAWLSFTGRSVALVSLRAPSRGRAAIYLDGVYQGTVDFYSPTVQLRRMVYSRSFPSAALHTVEVRLTGTKSVNSTSPRVDIDAFVVLE